MKRSISLFLALCMVLALLTACGSQSPTQPPAPTETEPATREFTDSTGRTVTIPAEITKIAISGPLSQVYILPLAGDMLVGVSNAFSADADKYLPAGLTEKIEIGQLYGGKGEMDLEALLAADPDVVIDIGETKGSVKDDLTALTEQTGIPFVHVFATVEDTPAAYRTLGKLLGREEQAEALASWCEETYAAITAMMERVDADDARKSLLFCLGDKGVNVLAEGSFHADTINLMGKNLAVIEEVSHSGAGNEVDMEQLLVWNPEVILFDAGSYYADIANSPQWQPLDAVQTGSYYETPFGPYGWLSTPPAVQRYLGMLWLGVLLYPEYADYSLQEEVTEYYRLFYGCDLTEEMYQNLICNAM